MFKEHNKKRLERIESDIENMNLETKYGSTLDNPIILSKNSIKVRNYILFMSSILEGSKTRKEIIWHSLGKKMKPGMYNATFQNLFSAGFIARESGKYQVTEKGHEYLGIFGNDKVLLNIKLDIK